MARIADISDLLLELGLDDSATDNERALAGLCLTKAEGAVRRYLKYDPVQAERTEYYPNTDFTLQGRATVWETEGDEAFVRRLSDSAVDELQLRHIPIRSISSLKIDYDGRSGTRSGSFDDATEKTEGIDYWPNYDMVDSASNEVCGDGIIRSEGRWPNVPGSVKIVYTAGYTQAELRGQDDVIDASPIWDAVIDEAARRFIKAKQRSKRKLAGFSGPMSSESLGDYSYSIDTKILDKLAGSSTDILPETAHKLEDFINYGWLLAS